jgi:hypothetical protein
MKYAFDEDGNVFGEEVEEVIENAKKAMPNHNNFVGNIILLMFFFVHMMGMFMLNLLVHQMNTLHGLFGFQRPLSLTKEDPLRNWDLKSRLDLL